VLLYGEKESLHVKGKLSDFFKQETEKIVPSLVDKWALKMNLFPTKITFRKTKRRWGSCSAKNELSFTSSLIQLPLECIEYIIVHELSHIKHKHHQKDFWLHVEKFMPNYKKYEQILKEYSPQI
jgi:predicted metal-dependent hydrolase